MKRHTILVMTILEVVIRSFILLVSVYQVMARKKEPTHSICRMTALISLIRATV